jgi:hypothetical protein
VKPVSESHDMLLFKTFAAEFDQITMFNKLYEQSLTKKQFVQLMIDLGFIQHSQKLNAHYMLEFANNLPMVNLLWQILTKLRNTGLSKIQVEK